MRSRGVAQTRFLGYAPRSAFNITLSKQALLTFFLLHQGGGSDANGPTPSRSQLDLKLKISAASQKKNVQTLYLCFGSEKCTLLEQSSPAEGRAKKSPSSRFLLSCLAFSAQGLVEN